MLSSGSSSVGHTSTSSPAANGCAANTPRPCRPSLTATPPACREDLLLRFALRHAAAP